MNLELIKLMCQIAHALVKGINFAFEHQHNAVPLM